MPDFSPGNIDDSAFVGVPVSIIILRSYVSWRKKKRDNTEIC
jgi:hypothetical protein